MTLNRGDHPTRRTILMLLVVILVILVVAVIVVALVSRVESNGGAVPVEKTDRGNGETPEHADEPPAAAGTDTVAEGPQEPLGSPLGGPRAARMERWEPRFTAEGPAHTVGARSTVVDEVVRAVSLSDPIGRDTVAVRIARGRWDELTTGITSEVPQIVWEPVERSIAIAGELQAVYRIEDALQAEYILRFENDRLLLLLYGTASSVDDAEIRPLPRP